jgi:two-component system, OmpR family, response regulator
MREKTGRLPVFSCLYPRIDKRYNGCKGGIRVARILVVDDDRSISEVLRLYLTFEGFEVEVAANGEEALRLFAATSPDAVVLDVMLPLKDGWDVCRAIRQAGQTPVLMLTAKDSLEDKLQGFGLGADDYLVKPFDPKEAVARVRALLRRTSLPEAAPSPDIIRVGSLEVNTAAYDVKIDGNLVDLKPREIQLLHFLLKNPNRVFTRDQLLASVWGYDFAGETRTVDVHIKRLREKLTKEKSIRLRTVWGVGYKLEVDG